MSNTIMSNNMKLINVMYEDVQTTINHLYSRWKNILKSQDITTGEITAQLLVMAPRMLQLLGEEDSDISTEKICLSLYSDILVNIGNDLKDEEEDSSFRSKEEMLEKFKEQVEKAEKAKEPEEKMEETNSIIDILNELGKDLEKLFKGDENDDKEE